MVKKKKKGPKLIPKPESPARGRLSSAEDLFDGFTTSIQSTDNNITTTDRKNKATNLSVETSINTPITTDNNNTTTGRIIPLSTPKDSNDDTTPDIDGYDKFGLILNKKKDSIDDTTGQLGRVTTPESPLPLQQTFPLRRLHSSDSYMSDSSTTTSEEDNIRMLKDEDNTEHIFVKHRKGEISDGLNESHYAPQRIRPSIETAESSITGNSLTPSAIDMSSIGYADTDHSDSNAVHLMTSYQGRIHADASFSSSSEDESDIAQQQLPLPLSSQQQLIPPLQMRLRQPMLAQQPDDVERSRSNTSFLMSSDDDQNIKNELSVYSLSDKLRRISSGPGDQNTGRHAPIEGHRIDSVETIQSTTPTEVNSFYPNSQSMIESTSAEAAKPRAQHDTSFLKNIRENWALSGSLRSASPDLLHSPSGAFVKEMNTEDMSSTPQDNTVQSLIYSDEDDTVRKYPSRPLLSAANDEETPLTTPQVQNEESIQQEVYISRYFNLLLLSFLNLLNGWTCFSIAPISEVAMKTLDIQPEFVVVLFLTANVCASFTLPPVLGRLGLRRTILLGSLLLMLGNMIKSSTSNTIAVWRVLTGFFISGLSGPFYQHTAPFLISTWFPKHERVISNRITMHSNQIGIGCSFVFGTRLVIESKDLLSYFHLLSIMASVIFVGVSLCLSESPPTPPGGQDIVMRGTLERPIKFTTNSSQPKKTDWRKTRRANMNQNKERSPESSLPYYYGSTDTSLATPTTEHNDNTSVKSSPFPNLRSNVDTSLPTITLDYSAYISGQLFRSINSQLPSTDCNGVEPILIQTHRFVDIEVCDNQMWRSIWACLTRVGFAQCVVSYASSGMTITTLTTFMSYLITSSNENKTSQVLVGVVGGLFQLLSVISSASASIRRNNTTQKSYMIVLALLSISSLILIICDLNLDSIERFGCNILILALVVSPVQPLSTQLGVDVASSISETTILIIQQVFSSFLSVCCILACTALTKVSSTSTVLYLLISIQILATIYFSTFHGQYTNYIESKRTRTIGAFQPPSPPRYPKPRTPRDRPVLDEWKTNFPHLWKPKS